MASDNKQILGKNTNKQDKLTKNGDQIDRVGSSEEEEEETMVESYATIDL